MSLINVGLSSTDHKLKLWFNFLVTGHHDWRNMKNSNVMKRVQEELAEVVEVNNIVEESHLPKLQYLDATIKETLRLHPMGLF